MKTALIALAAGFATLHGSCGLGFAWEEPLVGPYVLVACDVREQMAIGERQEHGVSGLVPQCVFAAGFDATHIIAAQHPLKTGSYFDVDKSKSNYWLVRVRDGHVEGPLDEPAFPRQRAAQSVSPSLTFTRVFDDLK